MNGTLRALPLAALLFAALGLARDASAGTGDPTVRDEGGTIVVVAVLDTPEARVRSILEDSNQLRGLFPDVLDEAFEADGACVRIHRHTRGLLRPFELFTRRCPTETGYRETLLESSDFGAYSSEWIVRGEGEGTRVEYRVRTEIEAPVPASTVAAAVRRAAVSAVSRLGLRVREE